MLSDCPGFNSRLFVSEPHVRRTTRLILTVDGPSATHPLCPLDHQLASHPVAHEASGKHSEQLLGMRSFPPQLEFDSKKQQGSLVDTSSQECSHYPTT